MGLCSILQTSLSKGKNYQKTFLTKIFFCDILKCKSKQGRRSVKNSTYIILRTEICALRVVLHKSLKAQLTVVEKQRRNGEEHGTIRCTTGKKNSECTYWQQSSYQVEQRQTSN
jgi:hypothetical protein